MRTKRFFLPIATLSLFCLISPLRADWIEPAGSTTTVPASDTSAREKPSGSAVFAPEANRIRAYIGVLAGFPTISGDLNGSKVLVNGSNGETIFLPDLKSGSGGGLKLGGRRVSDNPVDFGVELSFLLSGHKGSEGGLTKNATLLALNADLKMYMNASRTLQPFLSAGVCLPYLFIKDGAVMPSGSTDMATLNGFGFNFGAGLDQALSDRVHLEAGLTYRLAALHTAAGSDGKSMRIKPAQSLNSFVPQIGVDYYFN